MMARSNHKQTEKRKQPLHLLYSLSPRLCRLSFTSSHHIHHQVIHARWIPIVSATHRHPDKTILASPIILTYGAFWTPKIAKMFCNRPKIFVLGSGSGGFFHLLGLKGFFGNFFGAGREMEVNLFSLLPLHSLSLSKLKSHVDTLVVGHLQISNFHMDPLMAILTS